ncbi:hypothetical protein SAMN05421548_101567 [Paraburkholderia lycopersici]|uniref:Uncharacterized protein n=1 Tax=Paraburkholderia lycopersici TaxID=416944 RepID=A0A1G6H1G6_9BURK|nr:hypothetical protein SAMN05421548_101567 [Paraburkholderia lycopersici]
MKEACFRRMSCGGVNMEALASRLQVLGCPAALLHSPNSGSVCAQFAVLPGHELS